MAANFRASKPAIQARSVLPSTPAWRRKSITPCTQKRTQSTVNKQMSKHCWPVFLTSSYQEYPIQAFRRLSTQRKKALVKNTWPPCLLVHFTTRLDLVVVSQRGKCNDQLTCLPAISYKRHTYTTAHTDTLVLKDRTRKKTCNAKLFSNAVTLVAMPAAAGINLKTPVCGVALNNYNTSTQ